MSWIDELRHELAAAQMPPRRRRRIILELEDHLSCDPTAVERLGEPRELASRFADEIGTTRSLRAAFAVFLALAPFGLLFGALAGLVGPAHLRGSDENLIGPAVILGTQLAFVGGTLALVRAWRLRRAKSVPAAQAAILRRRAGLGTGRRPAHTRRDRDRYTEAACSCRPLVRAARLRNGGCRRRRPRRRRPGARLGCTASTGWPRPAVRRPRV